MSKNFYISDLHFGHKNAIKFDHRPFFSVEDMDKALIDNWNSVVSDKDTVYVLGDFSWHRTEKTIEILHQLKGHKRLIKGNHDMIHDATYVECFDKISDYEEIKDGVRNVVLCHYPMVCFKNHYYGWYHLYGHVHCTKEYILTLKAQHRSILEQEKPCNMYNVGCMITYMNYTPRTLDEIINLEEKNK